MKPALVVTLVHGTFARGAPWTFHDSALCTALKSLSDALIINEAFSWSGRNSIFDRGQATRDLIEHLHTASRTFPDAKHVLIAHSHGGNIALSAAHDIGSPHSICGVACLATPFLHAVRRDISSFSWKSITTAFSGVALIFWSLAWSAGLVACTLTVLVVFQLASIVFSGVLASLFESVLRAMSNRSEDAIDVIRVRVPQSISVLLVRTIGDEASFSLATGQFVSWIVGRLFQALEVSATRPIFGMRSTGIPRWLKLTWCLPILGVAAIHLWPQLILPLKWAMGTLVWLSLVVCTTLYDAAFLAIALLLIFCANALTSVWLGTLPDRDQVPANALFRFLFAALLPFSIEVYSESTPPGQWTLTQFEELPASRGVRDRTLRHSIYDDKRVHDLLKRWVAQFL